MASYLGFDFSTQQLKLVAVDEALKVVYENFVKFDTELPHYGTQDGVYRNGLRIVSPTIMWIEALDVLLEKAKADKFDFSSIKALSGAGQQHGSIYWKRGALEKLENLDPSKTLKELLKDQFAVPNSPVWMDGSTTSQCAKFVAAAGDEEALAKITGFRAYERLTGAQILRILETEPANYADTERISLVSSFGASLFCGHYANIDFSDGAGMNLMDIHTKEWCQPLLKVVGDDLESKLGSTRFSGLSTGTIAPYFVKRYGFSASCQVINFTGDNPGSLAGMKLKHGDLCLSLGTSDVVILWLDRCPESGSSSACVFANPVDPDAYMAILCFKNGSLVRERLRAGKSWAEFNSLLKATPKGNNGKIGIFFDEMEITPRNRQGTYLFDANGTPSESFTPAEQARALIEGQIMAKAAHVRDVGFKSLKDGRILVTGGASVNTEILQIIANVFNAKVYNAETANSAALGSAYRAKHALGSKAFSDTVSHLGGHDLVASPEEDAAEIYGPLVERYKKLEGSLRIAV